MSRKQQIRKPIPVRPQRARVPSLTPDQQVIIDAARELPQITDPLEVEIVLSAAVSSAREDPWTGVVEHASAVPSRRSLALLRAVAVLVPGSTAAVEADKLADLPEPGWATAITELALGECWTVDQRADAGYRTLLCTYRYADREHATLFLIDGMLGGAVKNAFATKDVNAAKEMLADYGEIESISAVDAHELLADAYTKVDGGPGLGIDPDVYVVRLLSRRRIELAQRA